MMDLEQNKQQFSEDDAVGCSPPTWTGNNAGNG